MTRAAHRQADAYAAEVLGDPTGGQAPGVNVNSIGHQMRMQARIQQGEPPFPHTLLWVVTIATSGVFGPIHYLIWLQSPQRRYRRQRAKALKAAGLL